MARTTRNQDAGAAVEERDAQSPPGTKAPSREADRQTQPEGAGETAPAAPPTYDDIARRAYELFQQRGAADGQEWDDWLRAEAELRDAPGRRDDEV
jgi:hypothetical protein